jgi:mannan endo-1,4-beta-mannosidase
MFDYFTCTKGLDNLIWVYGPNFGKTAADYYPGDHYADFVGLDAYTDFVDPEHIPGYEEVSRLGKPFGFTEFGPHGASNPPGDFDYRLFIRGIRKHFPKAVLFMSWNANWSLARNANVKEFLEDSWIVNREDLPPEISGGR